MVENKVGFPQEGSMKKPIQAALICMASWMAMTADAQVYKCPDPANNRTIYSDRPCAGDGVQLERKRSQTEMEYDRQRAATAYRSFQSQQRSEDASKQAAENANSRPTGTPKHTSLAETQDCRTARREADLARSVRTGTEEYRLRQVEVARMKEASACGQKYVAQRQPTHRDQVLVGELPDPIHPCQVGASCLGTVSEMRYTRTSENHFWREDGKSCTGSDTAVICD